MRRRRLHLVLSLVGLICFVPYTQQQQAATAGGSTASTAAQALDAALSDELSAIGARLQQLAAGANPKAAAAAAGGTGVQQRHRRRHRRAGPNTPGPVHRAAVPALPPLQDTKSLVAATELELRGHRLTIVTLLNDEFISATIRNDKQPFQKELLGVLMSLVRPGSTVVDAGANNGQFSAFLAAANPTGRVVSFEPQLRVFTVLCTNALINSLLNVEPHNAALSWQAGSISMTASVVDGSSTGQAYTEADKAHKPINYGGMRLGVGGERVDAITLDSLALQDVSVIKVDVQGAERLAFWGARDTIRRCLPVIAYEGVEAAMAAGIDKDLPDMPAEVRTFDVAAYLTSLGYTNARSIYGDLPGGDAIMLPPGHPALDLQPLAAAAGGGA